jgi:hypothetical protein
MFDIEKSFAEWRMQMLAAGVKSPVPLVELETHLREDVEMEMLAGANAERAFERATRKIGLAGEISDEFDKTSGNAARATNRNTFMHKRYLIANAVLWAAAILASAVIHAPVVFSIIILPTLAFTSLVIIRPKSKDSDCQKMTA